MSIKKTLEVTVPSPTETRKIMLELLKSGYRVSWRSGNRTFQPAFRVDLQTTPRWITLIFQRESGDKRRADVGIPVWVFRFILGYELDEL